MSKSSIKTDSLKEISTASYKTNIYSESGEDNLQHGILSLYKFGYVHILKLEKILYKTLEIFRPSTKIRKPISS
ncbi:hypothetical protein BpHYR1_044343 [Brachionus plicatilis]|uniref:Uncharacterized protein n=1 Tax=Brachionus plicatilis TaxID=10195 RepID=A0A3M7QPV5_BRAPC|nr:hypothetical protein BpHYR1_044343 [Brachionus plicatilis]